jgi:hypothetical protein
MSRCAARWLTASFLIALLTLQTVRADDAPAPAVPPVTDAQAVLQHYHQVAARPEFVDTQDSGLNPRLEDVLTEWFKNLGKKFGDFKYSSHMPAFESMLMTILVVVSVMILFYVIFRLTRRRSWTWRDEPESASSGQKSLRAPETYDDEITQAVRVRDWHTAWLASWRQFLSRLERRSLVEADRTRTNREYLGQLRDQPLPASALALLTGMVDAYDRFIYGRTTIGEAEWNQFHQQIEEAALLLHLEARRAPAPEAP